MSKETIHRSFSDILTACRASKCDVAFYSLPFKIERDDKTSTILKIEGGRTVTCKEKSEEEEEERWNSIEKSK